MVPNQLKSSFFRQKISKIFLASVRLYLVLNTAFMAANTDLKSGFQTDSNPNLTKNCDPDWNPDFSYKIHFKYRFRNSNPDFRSGFQINIWFWFKADLN